MGWEEMAGGVQRACLSTFKARDQVGYRPTGQGTTYPIRAIFRDAYQEVSIVDGASFSTVAPTLGVILSELPAAPRTDDEVDVPASPVRAAATYQVRDIQPDGEGMASLLLVKMTP